jgi:sulfoxide reductase heme-binding subunit YedZ
MIVAATTGMPVAWLVARAAGLVAFALLTLSVSLGLALSTRILGPARGKSLLAWHQTLMWTGVSMVALHGAALLLDPTMHFGFGAVLVPGVAAWRPVTVAAGIVTGWLMLMLALSFQVRRRIGQRRWRLLHYAGFAGFFLGLWHALTAGTDLIGNRGLVFAAVAAAPVLWLTFARILMPRAAARRPATTPAVRSAEQAAGGDRRVTVGV